MPIKKPLALNSIRSFLQKFYWLPVLLWAGCIAYFSLLSQNSLPDSLRNLDDKFLHLSIYFILGALLFLAMLRFSFRMEFTSWQISQLVVLCVAFGGLIEILQEFWATNRTGDWLDFAANAAGAALGVAVMARVAQRFRR